MVKKRKVKKKRAGKKIPKPLNFKGVLKLADVLTAISGWFLIVVSAISLIFSNSIILNAAALGFELGRANLYMILAAWVILALLTFMVNRMIKVYFRKNQMWGLLIIGLLMSLSVYISPVIVLVPAALVIISALIYLSKVK
ncbi:hypothetical protein ACFLZZ_02380 [Nanoarchaeota archaeon]